MIKIVYTLLLSIGLAATATAQNKPTTTTQVPAPFVAPANIYLPAAYPAGTPVNYVRTWEAMGPGYITEAAFIAAASATDGYKHIKETTQYIDGLGRPIQTVSRQVTPGNNPQDMVAPMVYDEFGRETHKFMPYVSPSTNGNFKTDPFTEQKTFLENQYPGEKVFYGKTNFEPSPLNRVDKSFAPGNSWAGSEGGANEHAMQMKYLINTAADDVKIWDITNTTLNFDGDDATTNTPTTTLSYPAGELYKNVSIDEHGNAVVEYKDKEGLVLLKKVQVDATMAADYSGYAGFLCTYYIYDDFNQLRFVIPPKAVAQLAISNWQLTNGVVAELCFRYEYDERNRMVAKKVPGAGWVYMLYDKRDRLVFTQDAKMRRNPGYEVDWMTTFYDGLNRPVLTGMLVYNGTRNQLKTYLDGVDTDANSTQGVSGTNPTSTLAYFTLNTPQTGLKQASQWISMESGFETTGEFTAEINGNTTGGGFTTNIEVTGNPLPAGYNFIALTITHYDNYNWNNNSNTYTTQYNSKLQAGSNLHAVAMPAQASNSTRGLVTGTLVRVLEDPNDLTKGNWLTNIPFYDDRNRTIQTQSINYKGGTEIATNLYDFTGKVLSSYMVHENPAAGINMATRSNMEYDHQAGRLLKTEKSVFTQSNDATAAATTTTSIVEYDALGQLLNKKLGQQKDVNGNYTNNPIETLNYDYNVRGWLKGINKDYATNTSGQNPPLGGGGAWFGMELNYDWGFANNQFNGNIAGTKWRSKGDGEQRAYGFGYDKVNRLLAGDFSQYNGSAYADNVNNINFDMQMGDGVNANSAYDENGNIKAMKQWGLSGLSSKLIDDLTYNYGSGNKLYSVSDAQNDINTKLGDFRDNKAQYGQTGGYDYDINGNLIMDTHKGLYWFDGDYDLPGIYHNHLNLPATIRVMDKIGEQKGIITYIYDATGNKLEKRVNEKASATNGTPQKTTTTTYLAGYVYENDQLQFFGHEEGRVRKVLPPSLGGVGGGGLGWAFDYMVKDHLGNVRMVLTDEKEQQTYPVATLEGNIGDNSSAIAVENNYYKIETANVVPKGNALAIPDYPNNNGNPPYNNNPNSNNTANSDKLYRLNANNPAAKMGLGITLKVMAGDEVKIFGKSYWKTAAGTGVPNQPIDPITVLDLLNAFIGSNPAAATKGVTGAALNALPGVPLALNGLLSQQPSQTNGKPKAYINWILFDEQFKPVISNTHTNSYFDQVEMEGILKSHGGAAGLTTGEITKNGYLYVYCSNESKIDVFFDNLQVVHNKGALLEESHYYPFGLVQQGISSRAANTIENKYKFNDGTELANKEFSDGSGLEWYETFYRSYDPQIGRFHQIDPLLENSFNISPYTFVQNNPLLYVDPLGLDTVRGKLPSGYKPNPGDVWINGTNTSIYDKERGWAPEVKMQEVTVSATKPRSGGLGSGLLFGWLAREYYVYNASRLKDLYTVSGEINYQAGSEARTALKSMVRRRLTSAPIADVLENLDPSVSKYNPVTKPTPRFWITNKWVTGLSRLGGVVALYSLSQDAAGLNNYYNNPTASNVVSPGTFTLNTGTTATMTFGGTVGFGVGLYFTAGRMAYNNFTNMPLSQQYNIISTQGPGGAVYYNPK